MSRTLDFGRHIREVVAVEPTEERLAILHLDSAILQSPNFLRVVGQELDALDPKVPEYLDSSVVATFIGTEAQRAIGVDSVQAFLLQQIRSKLVAQTDTPTLLRQIQEDASAPGGEDAQAGMQLFTAIASEAAEEIAGKAGGVEPHGHRIWPALALADHNRHMFQEAVGLAEAQDACIFGLLQRNRSLADVRQLDPHVSRHGFDLRRGRGENGATLQQAPQLRCLGRIGDGAHDCRQQSAEFCQRQPGHLRRGSFAQFASLGAAANRTREAQNLAGILAVQAEAHASRPIDLQTHRSGTVVGYRQTDRSSTESSDPVQGVTTQTFDGGEKRRCPIGRGPIGGCHIEESPSPQIEQTAFCLVHVTVHPCGKEML
jgi:hypothetical protein